MEERRGDSVRGAGSRRLRKWLDAQEYRERLDDLWGRTGSGAGARRLVLQERLGDCSGEESRMEVSMVAGWLGEAAGWDIVRYPSPMVHEECAWTGENLTYILLSVKEVQISVMIRAEQKRAAMKHVPISGRESGTLST